MLNKFILFSLAILLTSFSYGETIYQLRDSSTGTLVLTSKHDKNKSIVLEKVIHHPMNKELLALKGKHNIDLKEQPHVIQPDGRVFINIIDDQPSTERDLDKLHETLSKGSL